MVDGIGSVIIVLVLVVLISVFSVSAKAGSEIFSKGGASASMGETIHEASDVQAISYEQAFSLVQAYAKEKRRLRALETLQKQPNGDFHVIVGGAGFRYLRDRQTLLVSGYVASGQVDLVIPTAGKRIWDRLISIASLQPATLGGGQLELYTGDYDPRSEKPAVYLTKAYSGMPENIDRFVIEVGWLVQNATYWRDERWDEVFSGRTMEQLREEALDAEKWASDKNPL